MKQFVAILLLGCFTCYHFGFYAFYAAYQYKIEKDWVQRVFHESFDGKRVMKIPMKLPYSFEEEGFQLANIPFKLDGKAYRAIKKRFINDTFELVYVPDRAKIILELNTKQWVLSLVETTNSSEQNKIISQPSVKDYLLSLFSSHFSIPDLSQHHWKGLLPSIWDKIFLQLPTPPPWNAFFAPLAHHLK
ncbi:hypothetical protein [Cyclobacterium salsum]|uniref:hypothetical protein n=1 Tax=Cyclobacterium salsum TaxID=2666329 RepID=UPI001391E78E|nr:hypothetical protein [Cyclobacterium salsum]